MDETETSKEPSLASHKIEMINVDGAPGIFAHEIELNSQSKEFLGLPKEKQATIDYMDFAPNELIDPFDPRVKHLLPEQIPQSEDQLSKLLDSEENYRQRNTVYVLVNGVFSEANPQNINMLQDFKSKLANAEQPKLLIISGHGSTDGSANKWNIGEKKGKDVNLVKLLNNPSIVDVKDYNAVLLVSCNLGRTSSIQLPKDTPPVYFKLGRSGLLHAGEVVRQVI